MDRSTKPEALSDMLPPQDELEADLARLAALPTPRSDPTISVAGWNTWAPATAHAPTAGDQVARFMVSEWGIDGSDCLPHLTVHTIMALDRDKCRYD
jgi:hypothetical protein